MLGNHKILPSRWIFWVKCPETHCRLVTGKGLIMGGVMWVKLRACGFMEAGVLDLVTTVQDHGYICSICLWQMQGSDKLLFGRLQRWLALLKMFKPVSLKNNWNLVTNKKKNTYFVASLKVGITPKTTTKIVIYCSLPIVRCSGYIRFLFLPGYLASNTPYVSECLSTLDEGEQGAHLDSSILGLGGGES